MYTRGFTIIELMLAVAVVAILAAIAIPNYQQYLKKTNRTEVQAHLMMLSHQLASYKLVNQSFKDMSIDTLGGADFPHVNPHYSLSLTDVYGVALDQDGSSQSTWLLVATPKADSIQSGTGKITLMHNSEKCWYENQDDAVTHIRKQSTGELLLPNCPVTWQQ
ncbi:MAG TPA: type IV pilin protein [Acinetobacter parvus]|jgi:type IV pilus assembly protein PilE|uniref:type IV pilin protein n=1 Tax=Acinetobacter parvus TaxID=134533 RepID=UPI002C764143|nr:type IV pilin protein [Acinetobacter parvus]HRM14909.1 type IV pilin protein [Acinetobacter parvus]